MGASRQGDFCVDISGGTAVWGRLGCTARILRRAWERAVRGVEGVALGSNCTWACRQRGFNWRRHSLYDKTDHEHRLAILHSYRIGVAGGPHEMRAHRHAHTHPLKSANLLKVRDLHTNRIRTENMASPPQLFVCAAAHASIGSGYGYPWGMSHCVPPSVSITCVSEAEL